MRKKLDVSLIVCVADDVRIDQLLKTVDYDCEVVIVLNGATDKVKRIIETYENSNLFRLKTAEIPERNLSKSRNIGVKVATND